MWTMGEGEKGEGTGGDDAREIFHPEHLRVDEAHVRLENDNGISVVEIGDADTLQPGRGARRAMPIRYPVGPGTLLLCDYSLGGFREPEMIKRRPAVVVSPRLPYRDGLAAVVPLSGTAPLRDVAYVVRLDLPRPLPEPFAQTIWWAKCDMIATVGFARLDLFHTRRDHEGKRRYLHPMMLREDLERVMDGILAALGLSHLTKGKEASH